MTLWDAARDPAALRLRVVVVEDIAVAFVISATAGLSVATFPACVAVAAAH